MWLLKDNPSLLVDLYELTMAQVYFQKKMQDTAYFEVTIRRLPENWGFFAMAGLAEVESYIREYCFTANDIKYLRSTRVFSEDFLRYLADIKPEVKIRALPEGTVFFPNEPILEMAGPLICAQLLESYILNILGFSIIAATLATRITLAARGLPAIDFSLRRCQGPISSIRAARAAQMAGFNATSNVFAARQLDFTFTGTMAHSFVQVHESEESSFQDFGETYGENTILLVDTYDSIEGIKKAAKVAKQLFEEKNVKIRGIRLDSGDLVELSKFARKYFNEHNVPLLKIFASGDLDEFKIQDLLSGGAQIDGFGVGTRFAVSRNAPAVEIVYKLVQYGDKGVFKTSPDKDSRPGRKSVTRVKNKLYEKDVVSPFKPHADDLLKSFASAEPMEIIQPRLATELSCLDDSIKATRNPGKYTVDFA